MTSFLKTLTNLHGPNPFSVEHHLTQVEFNIESQSLVLPSRLKGFESSPIMINSFEDAS